MTSHNDVIAYFCLFLQKIALKTVGPLQTTFNPLGIVADNIFLMPQDVYLTNLDVCTSNMVEFGLQCFICWDIPNSKIVKKHYNEIETMSEQNNIEAYSWSQYLAEIQTHLLTCILTFYDVTTSYSKGPPLLALTVYLNLEHLKSFRGDYDEGFPSTVTNFGRKQLCLYA